MVENLGPDQTPPVISLIGTNPQEIVLGDSYLEQGAIAQDNRDGDISQDIIIDITSVDTTQLGEYPVTYNVKDSADNPALEVIRMVNVVEPPLPSTLTVSSFRLIDADTDQIIQEINEGDEINLLNLPGSNLGIEAVASDDVESLRMELRGPVSATRTENFAPYSLFGDTSGDYKGKNFVVGNYQLLVTPYSEDNTSGNSGTTISLNFSITVGYYNQMKIAENPVIANNVKLSFDQKVEALSASIFDQTGRLIAHYPQNDLTSIDNIYSLNMYFLQEGVYTILVKDNQGLIYRERIVVKRK